MKKIGNDVILLNDDCIQAMKKIKSESIDMIFADPPYFLSNGGISCKSGKIVSVDKGDWDKETDRNKIDRFNYEWIKECKRILNKNGTLWITGTFHNIFSVGQALTYQKYKILNSIVWQKEDPPPNMSHRMFTHAWEHIIWAKKNDQSKQIFNYEIMCKLNNGLQMTDIWKIPAVQKNEKTFGYHPTQKPLELLNRIILASTNKNQIILDPFCGSGTTGVAAITLGRKFIGIEKEEQFVKLSERRINKVLNKNKSYLQT
ncbi:site-specific DNA-methyltransferase (adenine-specific) [Bacillus oleivorans]|uniref:Methyltransferase n=1 Tax=Bacillus oleivorans TaxID=1448271 RepID=A0A285D6W1_9BACI|nr:site-specific DNA-methyltransferase [Bacillus oleivorans]SNX75550.1 site-specific DNA-methyltransferase (adenine-specific) [Bacillus oleivorans]